MPCRQALGIQKSDWILPWKPVEVLKLGNKIIWLWFLKDHSSWRVLGQRWGSKSRGRGSSEWPFYERLEFLYHSPSSTKALTSSTSDCSLHLPALTATRLFPWRHCFPAAHARAGYFSSFIKWFFFFPFQACPAPLPLSQLWSSCHQATSPDPSLLWPSTHHPTYVNVQSFCDYFVPHSVQHCSHHPSWWQLSPHRQLTCLILWHLSALTLSANGLILYPTSATQPHPDLITNNPAPSMTFISSSP